MTLYTQPHLASSLIMARPTDFGFNEQTTDNEFQNKPDQINSEDIRKKANIEFDKMAELLTKHKVEVLILEKAPTEQLLPDAIFPNNWFSTRADGTIFIYPMKATNRQAEVQIEGLKQILAKANYSVNSVVDLRNNFENHGVLEGTGSLIFHHPSASLFAAYSERCTKDALQSFSRKYHYQLFDFFSSSENAVPVYHTNVVMSCGESFAVIAKSCMKNDNHTKTVLHKLEEQMEDVIYISEHQMATRFCGNILQIKNADGQNCIVMSRSAHDGFESQQLQILKKHGELIVCDIPTIEYVGGGSARCMIAENFIPKSSAI
ncbi:MAG: arginine deiminase-related protein [Gammaproteobacteria bacterium]|nr:arginine deiminase-related protein [Gammaproteobacteria bacterium]